MGEKKLRPRKRARLEKEQQTTENKPQQVLVYTKSYEVIALLKSIHERHDFKRGLHGLALLVKQVTFISSMKKNEDDVSTHKIPIFSCCFLDDTTTHLSSTENVDVHLTAVLQLDTSNPQWEDLLDCLFTLHHQRKNQMDGLILYLKFLFIAVRIFILYGKTMFVSIFAQQLVVVSSQGTPKELSESGQQQQLKDFFQYYFDLKTGKGGTGQSSELIYWALMVLGQLVPFMTKRTREQFFLPFDRPSAHLRNNDDITNIEESKKYLTRYERFIGFKKISTIGKDKFTKNWALKDISSAYIYFLLQFLHSETDMITETGLVPEKAMFGSRSERLWFSFLAPQYCKMLKILGSSSNGDETTFLIFIMTKIQARFPEVFGNKKLRLKIFPSFTLTALSNHLSVPLIESFLLMLCTDSRLGLLMESRDYQKEGRRINNDTILHCLLKLQLDSPSQKNFLFKVLRVSKNLADGYLYKISQDSKNGTFELDEIFFDIVEHSGTTFIPRFLSHQVFLEPAKKPILLLFLRNVFKASKTGSIIDLQYFRKRFPNYASLIAQQQRSNIEEKDGPNSRFWQESLDYFHALYPEMLFSNPDKQHLIESFQEPTLPNSSESFLDPPPLTATSVVAMKEMYHMTSEELLFSIKEDLLLKTFYLFPMTHDDAYSELPYNPQNLAILTLYLIEKKTNMNAILLSTCIQKGLLSNTIYLMTRKETAQLGMYILEKFYFHLSSGQKSIEGKCAKSQGDERSRKEEIGKDKGRAFKLIGFPLYLAILDRVKYYYYNNQFETISHYSSFLIRYLALLLYKNQLEASQFLKSSDSTASVMTSELNYLRGAYFEESTMASFLLGLARLERLKEKEFTHGPLLYSHILLDLLSTSPSALNSPFEWKLQFLVDFYGTY